jgi:hypothetical protein
MKEFKWTGKLKVSFEDKDLAIIEQKHPELDFKKRYPTKIKVTHVRGDEFNVLITMDNNEIKGSFKNFAWPWKGGSRLFIEIKLDAMKNKKTKITLHGDKGDKLWKFFRHDYEKMMKKDKKKKRTKKKKKSGGGSECTCYSGECGHCQDIREREEELVKEQAKQGQGKTLDQEIKRSQDLISQMKQPSRCSEKSSNNMDILRHITSLGITLQEYNLLKLISSENGEPIENVLRFFNQYRNTGLTLHEIVEAYQLGGILEICEDLSECRTLLHSKKESIMLMRERMIKEFCKAKNDTGCVGITSPEFLKFLHYFRPPPESGDYPDNELLDYVRLWNDCDCGSQIDYSSPSVWRGQRSL